MAEAPSPATRPPRGPRRRSAGSGAPVLAGALWLLATAAGLALLWRYAYEPGVPIRVPGRWPAESSVPRAPGRPALVVMAHPRCPCTRATLRELDRLMAQVPGEASAYVLFFAPSGAPAGWEESDLWAHATSIPGVEPLRDEGGVEARRFGAAVSGQVALYDEAGALVFQGGITPGRGHSGDNDGRAAVVAHLRGEPPELRATPVYGCALLGEVDGLQP